MKFLFMKFLQPHFLINTSYAMRFSQTCAGEVYILLNCEVYFERSIQTLADPYLSQGGTTSVL